jgi:hypothetical protein
VSPLMPTPPELKRLWIRVLKRVLPDLAQEANDATVRRDEFALKVLEPNGPAAPRQATAPQSTNQPSSAPQQPSSLAEREGFGILWAACAVICLLLYVIVEALRETVGRNTSLSFLVALTAAVLWWITKSSKLSYNQKAKWVAAVASGVILVGVSLFDSHPRTNPLFPSARAATAQAPVAMKDSDHPRPASTTEKKATVVLPRLEARESLASQLSGYIEGAKNQVAQKWNLSEVAGSTPAGATVYIQFAIRRRGSHEVPTMETSSGYPSLDASCLRAVNQIRTFDHLPQRYSGDSLTVLYHCTYPGSTKLAEDSSVPPVQQPSYAPADAVHGVQQPSKETVGTN